jgi:hypothetical protein
MAVNRYVGKMHVSRCDEANEHMACEENLGGFMRSTFGFRG